nr:MAG TPA: hypothetical protein [Caudoviricetes sp.]
MIHKNTHVKQRVDIYRRMNDRKLGTQLQITQSKEKTEKRIRREIDRKYRQMEKENEL